MPSDKFCALDWVLRDSAILIFNFDFHILVGKHLPTKIEDPGESIRVQTMVDVVSNIRLEQAGVGRVV